jgi:hypothetical protein
VALSGKTAVELVELRARKESQYTMLADSAAR